MNKFSDFGINTLNNKRIFAVPVVSIDEMINCEIKVIDFEKDIKTKNGLRYIVKIEHENMEKKFFTGATPIKEALDRIQKDNFPFLTTIKQQRFGSGTAKTYYFT